MPLLTMQSATGTIGCLVHTLAPQKIRWLQFLWKMEFQQMAENQYKIQISDYIAKKTFI